MGGLEYILARRREIADRLAEIEKLKPKPKGPEAGVLGNFTSGFVGGLGTIAQGLATPFGDDNMLDRFGESISEYGQSFAPEGPKGSVNEIASALGAMGPIILGSAAAPYLAPEFIGAGLSGAALTAANVARGAQLARYATAGAALADIPMITGEHAIGQKEENEGKVVNPGLAILSALPSAALDTIGAGLLLHRVFGVTSKVLKAGDKVGNIAKGVAKGAGLGIITEMPTEVTQEIIGRLQAGKEIDSQEAIDSYAHVARIAGTIGGLFGGAGGAYGHVQDVNEVRRLDAVKAQEEARAAAVARVSKRLQDNAVKQIFNKPSGRNILLSPDAMGPIPGEFGTPNNYPISIEEIMATEPHQPATFTLGQLGESGNEIAKYRADLGLPPVSTITAKDIRALPEEMRLRAFEAIHGSLYDIERDTKKPVRHTAKQRAAALQAIRASGGDITPEALARAVGAVKSKVSDEIKADDLVHIIGDKGEVHTKEPVKVSSVSTNKKGEKVFKVWSGSKEHSVPYANLQRVVVDTDITPIPVVTPINPIQSVFPQAPTITPTAPVSPSAKRSKGPTMTPSAAAAVMAEPQVVPQGPEAPAHTTNAQDIEGHKQKTAVIADQNVEGIRESWPQQAIANIQEYKSDVESLGEERALNYFKQRTGGKTPTQFTLQQNDLARAARQRQARLDRTGSMAAPVPEKKSFYDANKLPPLPSKTQAEIDADLARMAELGRPQRLPEKTATDPLRPRMRDEIRRAVAATWAESLTENRSPENIRAIRNVQNSSIANAKRIYQAIHPEDTGMVGWDKTFSGVYDEITKEGKRFKPNDFLSPKFFEPSAELFVEPGSQTPVQRALRPEPPAPPAKPMTKAEAVALKKKMLDKSAIQPAAKAAPSVMTVPSEAEVKTRSTNFFKTKKRSQLSGWNLTTVRPWTILTNGKVYRVVNEHFPKEATDPLTVSLRAQVSDPVYKTKEEAIAAIIVHSRAWGKTDATKLYLKPVQKVVAAKPAAPAKVANPTASKNPFQSATKKVQDVAAESVGKGKKAKKATKEKPKKVEPVYAEADTSSATNFANGWHEIVREYARGKTKKVLANGVHFLAQVVEDGKVVGWYIHTNAKDKNGEWRVNTKGKTRLDKNGKPITSKKDEKGNTFYLSDPYPTKLEAKTAAFKVAVDHKNKLAQAKSTPTVTALKEQAAEATPPAQPTTPTSKFVAPPGFDTRDRPDDDYFASFNLDGNFEAVDDLPSIALTPEARTAFLRDFKAHAEATKYFSLQVDTETDPRLKAELRKKRDARRDLARKKFNVLFPNVEKKSPAKRNEDFEAFIAQTLSPKQNQTTVEPPIVKPEAAKAADIPLQQKVESGMDLVNNILNRPQLEKAKAKAPSSQTKAVNKGKRVKAEAVPQETVADMELLNEILQDLKESKLLDLTPDGKYRVANAQKMVEEAIKNRTPLTSEPKPAVRMSFRVKPMYAATEGELGPNKEFTPAPFSLSNASGEFSTKDDKPEVFQNYRAAVARNNELMAEADRKYLSDKALYDTQIKAYVSNNWVGPAPKAPEHPGKGFSPVAVTVSKDGKPTEDKTKMRYAVMQTGFDSTGNMTGDRVVGIYNDNKTAQDVADAVREDDKMKAYNFRKRVSEGEIEPEEFDLDGAAVNTDGMKVVLEGVANGRLFLTPEQANQIAKDEQKDNSAMRDEELRKEFGETFNIVNTLLNDLYTKSGLQSVGIALKLQKSLDHGDASEGSFSAKKKLISMSMAANINPNDSIEKIKSKITSVFTHETFHAMRHLGLISQEEYDFLVNEVKTKMRPGSKQTYMQAVRANKQYEEYYNPERMAMNRNGMWTAKALERLNMRGEKITADAMAQEYIYLSEDIKTEEAIAAYAADWAHGKMIPQKIASIFQRIVDFITKIFTRSNSIYSADKIFESMTDGSFAKRTPTINKMDGLKFSIPIAGEHTILVHRVTPSSSSAFGENDFSEPPVQNLVLQVVDKDNKEVVRLSGRLFDSGIAEADHKVGRYFEVDYSSAPLGSERMAGTFVRNLLRSLSDNLFIHTVSGWRSTGGKKGALDPNQVLSTPLSDEAMANYDFGQEVEQDDDATLLNYDQPNRLDRQAVYARMQSAINAKAQGITLSQVNKTDREATLSYLGVPDGDARHFSVTDTILLADISSRYNDGKPFTPDEISQLTVSMAPASLRFKGLEEDHPFFDSHGMYSSMEEGKPIFMAEGEGANYFPDDSVQYSIAGLAANDRAYESGADMSLPEYTDFNAAFGERVRPAGTHNHQIMYENEIAYTKLVETLQWLARKITPQALKRVLGVSSKDINEWTERIYITMVDKDYPIGKMVAAVREASGYIDDRWDPMLQAELRGDEVIPEIERIRREFISPFIERMVANGVDLDVMNDFLLARHAPERNLKIRDRYADSINRAIANNRRPDPTEMYGSGITDEQSVQIMRSLESDGLVTLRTNQDGTVDAIGGKLFETAELFDALIAETNRIRIDNGLLPPLDILEGGINSTNYKHYAPLIGSESEDGDIEDRNFIGRTALKYNLFGRESKTATGRYSPAKNIMEHAILQNFEAILRGKRAKVGQAMVELYHKDPSPFLPIMKLITTLPKQTVLSASGKYIEVVNTNYKTSPNYYITKVGGKEVVFEFTMGNDGELNPQAMMLSRALRGFGQPSDAMGFVRVLQKINQFLTKANTAWNPEFTITNLIRDFGFAMFNVGVHDIAGVRKDMMKNWRPAFKAVYAYDATAAFDESFLQADPNSWTDAQFYHALRKSGGLTQNYGQIDITSVYKDLQKDIAKASGTETKGHKALEKIKGVVNYIEHWNTAVEHAIRLATFKSLMTRGVSLQRSAQAAKGLTVNFNKGGEQKILLNALYLFYSASIQGSMTMFSAMAKSKKLQKAALYVTAMAFLMDQMNGALSDEDDEGRKAYDQLQQWKKESAINIPIGEGHYFSLPLPWGLSFFWNTGRAMSDAARTGDVNKNVASTMSGLVSSFSPIGSMENFYNFVAPTVVDPILNVANNTKWDGSPIQKENFPVGVQKPQSQLYWNSTSATAKTSAEILNSMTGGDKHFPGGIDVSPDMLEFGFSYLLGGAGMFVLRGGDFFRETAPAIMSGDDWEWNQIPFLRKVIASGSSKQSDSKTYHDNFVSATNAEGAYKAALKEGNGEMAADYMDVHGADIQMAAPLRRLHTLKSKITETINQIKDATSIDAAQKAATIKILKEKEAEIVQQANSMYRHRIEGTE